MNIEQMHLAVKLGLDKTEGLTYAAFEPEEIDFWLNETIDRFIKIRYSGVNPKQESFEQSQKRVDDLRSLVKEIVIVPTASSATEVSGDYTLSFKPNSYHIDEDDFPADYLLFLNDEVSVTFNHEVTGSATTLRTYPLVCTSDTYSAKINDPYSEHRLHLSTARPLRLFSSKGIELITDGQYTIPSYFLKYLRKPARVNLALTDAQTAGASDIVEGIRYQVSGDHVHYNGTQYNVGEVFTGVVDVTAFTGAGTATALVANCDLPEHTHREIVLLTVKVLTENIESPRYQTESIELSQNE
jgi:hypothetical protein